MVTHITNYPFAARLQSIPLYFMSLRSPYIPLYLFFLFFIAINDRKARKDKVKEILKTFDLESIKNSKNDELSIGERRRVQLAREFMHDMDLLFLDEPTVGLDPSARRMLLDYIKKTCQVRTYRFFHYPYYGRGRISL